MSKKLEEYIENATNNIDLVNEMSKTSDKYKHRDFGEVASKYLETLQRSNEQLVKIAAIIQKKEGVTVDMSIEEKDQIFDMIREDK